MAKLHELLANRKGRNQQAEKVLHELTDTLQKKEHHFTRKLVSFTSNTETGGGTTVEEQMDLQTTVPKELKWISEFLIKSLDICYQVEETNTKARADVILENGTTLIADVPATALLEMEKRVKDLRSLVVAIRTLDPAKGFLPDTASSKDGDVFVARDLRKNRTKKVQKPLLLHAGTDKIPAQVQMITEDEIIGVVTTQEWSGLLTVADKGKMLERVEIVSRALKAARQRANDTVSDAQSDKVGAAIINYVFGI